MNDVIRTILTRRSVRDFKDRQIKEKDLETILECASYAPSAMSAQNWLHSHPRLGHHRKAEWMDRG
jgi:nitroreductase